MSVVAKKYKTIRYIEDRYKAALMRERSRIRTLKAKQRRVIEWIRQAKLSWVKICIPEPNSSGYRFTAFDIHSPSEAYIFWSNGGFRYSLRASVFEDDFGDIPEHYEREILYACDGLLQIKLTAKNIAKLKKENPTDHLSCCHTQRG